MPVSFSFTACKLQLVWVSQSTSAARSEAWHAHEQKAIPGDPAADASAPPPPPPASRCCVRRLFAEQAPLCADVYPSEGGQGAKAAEPDCSPGERAELSNTLPFCSPRTFPSTTNEAFTGTTEHAGRPGGGAAVSENGRGLLTDRPGRVRRSNGPSSLTWVAAPPSPSRGRRVRGRVRVRFLATEKRRQGKSTKEEPGVSKIKPEPDRSPIFTV